ncbi:hypothetical protein TNIN_71231 [Trichonephila inaurata madagascariensis]|uniref:Uncharacterized protein n=1 Tax=Trichonephila inaurata madagascariensis TaxID=2747483 RepID=A0A8X7CLU7_9ARAC|nr:hypothetical protein TNIN_71231 [Trichonephila inaurata madagascariensis]
MSEEYGGCSISSHPQRRSSCRTHSALYGLALSGWIIALSQDPDVYPEHHIVPVLVVSTVRSLFSMRNKVANNGTTDVICDDDHRFDGGKDF